MPRNKDALARYRIIHRELKTGFKYKTKRLAVICSDQIGIPISQRTIQKDLSDLRYDTNLGFYLPIEEDKVEKAYYYAEVPTSIFPSLELSPEEIYALLFYAKTLSQYSEYPAFKEITNAMRKVILESNIEPSIRQLFDLKNLIDVEKHPQINGLEFIPDLLGAINERRVVEIQYQKFGDIRNNYYRLRPLLLKEDKHLWYLVGESIEKTRMTTLALDRIIELGISDEVFEEIALDAQTYFKHSFGITVTDEEPIDIEIAFTRDQGNYVKTLRIHPTQEIVEDSKNQLLIKLKVKPSYEFYSKIISYGGAATIISPEHVKTQITELLKEALVNYQ